MLAPPVTFPIVGWLHALALLLCSFMLACVSAWFTAILVLQQAVQLTPLDSRARLLVEAIVWIVFALVMAPGAALAWKSFGADSTTLLERDGPRLALWRSNSALMAGPLILMAAVIACFMGFVHDTIRAGDAADIAFKIERFVAGGIVSPAPITICLFAALLAGMLAGLRRLSMVGQGYTALARANRRRSASSPVRRTNVRARASARIRAAGNNESRDLRRLTALVDMPVQNLPRQYLVGIIAAVGLVIYGAGRVVNRRRRCILAFRDRGVPLLCSSWHCCSSPRSVATGASSNRNWRGSSGRGWTALWEASATSSVGSSRSFRPA